MKELLMICLLGLMASCTTTQTPTGETKDSTVERLPILGAAGLAGYAASELTKNESDSTRIAATAAASGLTYIIGDKIHGNVVDGRFEYYEEGFKDGQANQAKDMYWIIQRMQQGKKSTGTPVYTTYEFPGAEVKDGVKHLPHTVKLRVIEDVKK